MVDNAGHEESRRLSAMDDPRARGPAPWYSKALATAAGNLFLAAGSLVLGVLAAASGWLPPRGRWALAVMRLWSALLLRACGVRLAVHRDPGLDAGASYVYLANHQSLFDIPALLLAVPGRLRMVAKQSLFRIPVFGWALSAAGFVSVDRADRTAARQSFAAAERRLRSGGSILLFPEGTRRAAGEALLPFKRGGFLLALRTGLPIVPVGVRGTLGVQPRGRHTIQPGPIEVRFGKPIAVAEFGVRHKRELIAEVRRRLAELAGLQPGEVAEARDEGDPREPSAL
jgi:1-acyl-sn-glycerol-3-phosphate acyltransferase